MKTRRSQRIQRHNRVRAKISGTEMRPRLSVFRSAKHIYAQLINDEKNETIIGLTDKSVAGKTKEERAEKLGEKIASEAAKKKIVEVVFDRGGHAYMGRVKALADGARKGGLKF